MAAMKTLLAALLPLSMAVTAGAEYTLYKPHTGELIPVSAIKASPAGATAKSLKGAPLGFNVVYDDVATGFNDPTLGAARRAVVDDVLAYVSTVLNHTATIEVRFEASQSDGTGALASAGTLYGNNAGYNNGVAFEHITTGVDPSVGDSDIYVTVDFGYVYYLGSSPSVPGGQTDLFTVLLHEVTHGLGVASLTDGSGGGTQITGTRTGWDEQIFRIAGGTRVFAPGTLAYDGGGLAGGDGTLEFRGLGTDSLYPTSVFPRIYTPVGFAPGSSMSHWQLSAPTPVSVMRPAIPTGTAIRAFQPFEIKTLESLGYSVSSVEKWSVY